LASEPTTHSKTHSVVVSARGETREFACAEDERILYAGLRAGLPLPYECASGTCGTCKAAVNEGTTLYAWDAAPGRKYTRAERNEVLTCQSFALSALTLTLPGAFVAKPARIAPEYFSGTMARSRLLVPDVIEFDVELNHPMSFDAGQFVLLEVEDVRGARSYSMVNFEPESRVLRFLVKRFPGGALTEWMFSHPLDGTQVRIFGPLGRASFDSDEIRHVVCIAGGSGIAGMMSILESGKRDDHFDRHDMRVFFGVRTLQDAFYLDELKAHARRFSDRMRITLGLSHEEPSEAARVQHPELEFDQGFIHEIVKRALAESPAETTIYVAGPPPMVDATLRMLLLELKHSGSQIRYDKFS
jgi:toluene monooxygenase electron transfer component